MPTTFTDMTTESEIALISEYAQTQIPGFHFSGSIESVDGGLLNHVFRLSGEPNSVIAKYAPPYVASNHEMPLDPERLDFEARALGLFGKNNLLFSLSTNYLRVPQLIAHNAERHILFMEDAGRKTASLDQLPQAESDDIKTGTVLGHFIAGLHAKTSGVDRFARTMSNASIQKTRYMIQYQPSARYFLKTGIPDYESLGRTLELLGREFMKPGICLTMGDLWPRSLLWNGESWYLIDWEFSHFGSPAQDTGHLLAHLWMLEHQSTNPERATRFSEIRNAFIKAYQERIESLNPSLFSSEFKKQALLHAAAEILARTTGAFQHGYVYAGLEPNNSIIQEAVQKAANWVRNAENTDLYTLE